MRISEIQASLPWQSNDADLDTLPYSADFQADPRPHKDFQHALGHVFKAAGRLAGMVDELDHGHMAPTLGPEKVADVLADLVISALRMANTGTKFIFRPTQEPMYRDTEDGFRTVNLEYAVLTRLLQKNEVELVTDNTGRCFFMPRDLYEGEPYPGLRKLTFDELYDTE